MLQNNHIQIYVINELWLKVIKQFSEYTEPTKKCVIYRLHTNYNL